jgi:type I restriction enzyme S subunit
MMSGKMYRFRPHPDVMRAKYLMYFLLTYQSKLEIDRMKTGINDSGLNLTHDRFATLKLPLAPINEQRRIVTKIDELLSELDKGIEALASASEQLKACRQSVLKHAFEGKLTSRPNNVTGKFQGGIASLVSLSSNEQDEENLAPLPSTWRYVRLGQLTNPKRPITYGVIKLGADVTNGIPTLRSSDVRRLHMDLDSVKRISPEIAAQYRRTFLEGGEVLVTVRGTLGGVAIVPNSLSGWNISREVAMIAPSEAFDPMYLQYLLASPQIETWFKARVRGVAYTGINLETLRETPVILCSKGEQKKIAQEVAARMSVIDATELEIQQQLAKETVLRQSILKQAFSGQLVAQDSKDEPASALLERIRAEREAAPSKKTRNGNKNSKNGKKNAA